MFLKHIVSVIQNVGFVSIIAPDGTNSSFFIISRFKNTSIGEAMKKFFELIEIDFNFGKV